MTLKEHWSQYQTYTKDATDYGRKLGFAGAAICWLLQTTTGTFPETILWSLSFLVLFFIADILQSLSGALFLFGWLRIKEITYMRQQGSLEGSYAKPGWLDYPAFTLFWLKFLLLLAGYYFIGKELFGERM